jgi:hypothetical protein
MGEGLLSEMELGVVLGQSHAFGLVAGRCSAAQAQTVRRLREEKLFKACCEKWEDFCPQYLKMCRAEADRIIRLLEEFGPTYFELSQVTRISAETYRAIAPAIENGALHFNGEAIPLNTDNSRKLAAAVAEMRSALPKTSLEEAGGESQLTERLSSVEKTRDGRCPGVRKNRCRRESRRVAILGAIRAGPCAQRTESRRTSDRRHLSRRKWVAPAITCDRCFPGTGRKARGAALPGLQGRPRLDLCRPARLDRTWAIVEASRH